MNKFLAVSIIIIVLGMGGFYMFKNKVGSVNIPNSQEQPEVGNEENSKAVPLTYLSVPKGFAISIFAKDLPNARVILLDPKGRMLVSQPSDGKISVVSDTNNDNVSDTQKVLLSGLKKPHGMTFDCKSGECFLYVAEYDKLTRYLYNADDASVSGYKKLIDLPSGIADRHFTRDLLFLPSPNDDTLLISIGSSCNVCVEKDSHGSIISYDIKIGKTETYARGLRNAVFMILNPLDGKVFATEMGRDGLGDNTPPDEINIIEKGKNYGWPNCYGKNIHDTNFDKNTYIRNPCMEPFETQSFVDLQAHSAPLGLGFIPEEGWPEEYWYNMLVSYHGSWNRSVPTGYKIVRIKMNSKGQYLGTEDFITGWLTSKGTKIGRPVDIKIFSGGQAFITDDQEGVVYRLYRTTASAPVLQANPIKPPVVSGPCYVGGCSGQICSDQKDAVSTCEYREEYGCYQKTSTCKRQASGQCGWTQTPELKACLQNSSSITIQ